MGVIRKIGQRYTAEVRRSVVPGYSEYMVFDPSGAEHCAGRYRGSVAEAREHADKILSRFNMDLGWIPMKLSKASRNG
jgi:hypothetical protein